MSGYDGPYGTSKDEALRAYLAGFPSLLPESNRWKSLVEEHRWGHHWNVCPARCPVLGRDDVDAGRGLKDHT